MRTFPILLASLALALSACNGDASGNGKLGPGILDEVPPFQTSPSRLGKAPRGPLVKVKPGQLPSLSPDGDLAAFKVSVSRQIESCLKQNLDEKFVFDTRKVTRRQWCVESGRAFLDLADSSKDFAELYQKARTKFEWYRSVGQDGAGTTRFTGYYLPEMSGSRDETATHAYPLYSKPDDLVLNPDGTFAPYYTREQIDIKGVLRGKGLEIAYVDDVFTAYLLHVQGSGVVRITKEDGSVERFLVNYAAKNGHPYRSIRKILEEQGVDPKYLTAPGMRRYFRENPEKMMPTLIQNPSYIFFREMQDGPYGASGVALTSGHSIAIDKKVFPMGLMSFVSTSRPVPPTEGDGCDLDVCYWQNFTRLAVTQDTGGAIVGPGRVDIYWGEGAYAEFAAGTMNQTGQLFFAVLP